MFLFVINNSSAESVLSEANIESQSLTISSNTMDAQSRTSTSSSEYLIPVKVCHLNWNKCRQTHTEEKVRSLASLGQHQGDWEIASA